MNNLDQYINDIFFACSLAGYTPVGASERNRLEDGCQYISNTTPPALTDEDTPAWNRGIAASAKIASFYASLDGVVL